MLTVLTWYWRQPKGRASYTADHVNIFADMVRRNLSMPHRIACVTAHPEGLDSSIEIITPPGDFEDVRIPTWGESLPQCLRRLAMFRPDAGDIFGERFVSMDLDCVVGGQLDPVFERDEDFVMYRGTSRSRPYNGSMMLLTAGSRPQVYTEFTPERAIEAGRRYLGSDQAWISHILGPGEATFGPEHGVKWWKSSQDTEDFRLLFFPGPTKPWELFDQPEISGRYHQNIGGRCLVLGYGKNVWDDAAAALETGSFDHVIASPEAAEYWPGRLFVIARSDWEAEHMVSMNGFEEVVFCGRTERAAA